MDYDYNRFDELISAYNQSEPRCTIGTLNERCLHSIIKHYYEPDVSKHEVNICGYVADIQKDDTIIEVQTNNFSSLSRKLDKYLDSFKVKIIYPVSHVKHIVWIDPETGEVVKRNKSPKIGTGVEFLYEASKLKKYINSPSLSFDILLIDMDEYRLLNGWSRDRKRGSVRCDRKPLHLHDIITVNSAVDLEKILPDGFDGVEFDFKDFAKALKLKGRTARYSLNTLLEFGYIEAVGKRGNAIIYKKIINK